MENRIENSTVQDCRTESQRKLIANSAGRVHVTIDAPFTIDPEEYDFLTDGLAVEGSGAWTNETDEMKMLKALYAEARNPANGKIYLFALEEAETGGVQGDMPRGKHTGYIFGSEINNPRLIAHELGHGAFGLEHTFETYGVSKSTTNNLMDYAEGNHLTCWQWDLVHNPRPVWGFLEGDEEGMLKGTYTIEFSPTSNFVSMDMIAHKNFIDKYTTAYKNYQTNYNKDSEKLMNQYLNIKINGKIYKTNSVATIFGRDFNKAYIGRFQGVYEIDEFLEYLVAHSHYVFQIWCRNTKEDCVLNNSVGVYTSSGYTKLLDYKYELYKILKDNGIKENDLVAIDDVVYNANEIGNYVWAMVLTYNGILISPNFLAEAGSLGRNDEPWEQRAINRGKEKVRNLVLNQELVERYIQEFTFFYNNEWISLSPFKD